MISHALYANKSNMDPDCANSLFMNWLALLIFSMAVYKFLKLLLLYVGSPLFAFPSLCATQYLVSLSSKEVLKFSLGIILFCFTMLIGNVVQFSLAATTMKDSWIVDA